MNIKYKIKIENNIGIDKEIIDNCPSPQCREYMKEKNRKEIEKIIFNALSEAIDWDYDNME